MIRILYITSRADYGGGPEHIFRLIESLNTKLQIFAACPNDKPYYERYAGLIGEKNILQIPHRKFSISKLFALRKFIEEKNIDIVHSHGKGAGLFARILKRLTNVKCVHTFHGLHIEENNSLKEFFYLSLEGLLARGTDGFISVSPSEKEKLKRNLGLNENRLSLIPNGVPVHPIAGNRRIQNDRLKLLQITRFDPAKNPELLMRIAAALRERGSLSNFEFVIIGDGKGRYSLEKSLAKEGLLENFKFLGFVEDVTTAIENADVYVSTSLMEGLPLSVMSAMAGGLPVVATNVTGNIDLVEDGFNGFLFAPEEPLKAAEALDLLYSDMKLYSTFSGNARKAIEENFSLEAMVNSTLNLYTQIFGEK